MACGMAAAPGFPHLRWDVDFWIIWGVVKNQISFNIYVHTREIYILWGDLFMFLWESFLQESYLLLCVFGQIPDAFSFPIVKVLFLGWAKPIDFLKKDFPPF